MEKGNDELLGQIEQFLEENALSPFVTVSTLIREMKLRGQVELAAEVKRAVAEYDLSLGNRTLTLLQEIESEDDQ